MKPTEAIKYLFLSHSINNLKQDKIYYIIFVLSLWF